MKSKIKDLYNVRKWKKKYNTIEIKYNALLEARIEDKDKIIQLQENLLASKQKIKELKEKIK